MIPSIRNQYNTAFTEQKYQQMLAELSAAFKEAIPFRLAETPVFIDSNTKKKLITAGDEIISYIKGNDFYDNTAKSFQHVSTPPNEKTLPDCIVMDFAICQDNKGQTTPQLIELQGFPSLFAFEVMHNKAFRNNFEIPLGFSAYLNGLDEAAYLKLLESTIKGNQNKHTVLLELFPNQQKTKIDFFYTEKLLQIPTVCVSELFTIGNKLYYKQGEKSYPIERIYNRVIWDELPKQPMAIQEKANLLLQDLDIEWVSHPNHYYRISKYLMPYLKQDTVPATRFLSEISSLPNDLENYVLKPLFSFAGQGVVIDIEPQHLQNIKDPDNWILQQKVKYAPIVKTPTGNAIAEIRLFYFLEQTSGNYIATCNLTRISKGKMIGVSYNNTATWVGGSIAYFEIAD